MNQLELDGIILFPFFVVCLLRLFANTQNRNMVCDKSSFCLPKNGQHNTKHTHTHKDYWCPLKTLEEIRQHSIEIGSNIGTNEGCWATKGSTVLCPCVFSFRSDVVGGLPKQANTRTHTEMTQNLNN